MKFFMILMKFCEITLQPLQTNFIDIFHVAQIQKKCRLPKTNLHDYISKYKLSVCMVEENLAVKLERCKFMEVFPAATWVASPKLQALMVVSSVRATQFFFMLCSTFLHLHSFCCFFVSYHSCQRPRLHF